MDIKLTDRQRQILDLIRQAIAHTGFPPTRAEIAQILGFKSANAAEDHLRALARKGMIELTAGTSRGIRLTQQAQAFSGQSSTDLDDPVIRIAEDQTSRLDHADRQTGVKLSPHGLRDRSIGGNILLPLIGRVAAGFPILATENIEQELSVDPNMFAQAPDYLLKVKGMSMRDAGILDGDLLAIKKTAEARHGEIVVARIDDEVTVKRLNKHGSKIQLLPENSDFEPIVIQPGQDFSLEGIALGLIRTTPLH
jgi:repressor LexA